MGLFTVNEAVYRKGCVVMNQDRLIWLALGHWKKKRAPMIILQGIECVSLQHTNCTVYLKPIGT